MENFRDEIYELREAMRNHTHYCEMQGKSLHGYNDYGCVYEIYIPYAAMYGPSYLFDMKLYDCHDNKIGSIALQWDGEIIEEGIITISHEKFLDMCVVFAEELKKSY